MRQFRDWPAALQRKWLLSWAAGAAFLTVGITVFLALEDRPLLIISTLLAACVALRCMAFYRTAAGGNYEVITGICVGLGHAGLRRSRTVRMFLTDGTEYEVALDKRIALRIGNRYQLYFHLVPGLSGGQAFPRQALMDSQFLALEDLGEYHIDKDAEDAVQKSEPH